jgi:hypothetical protein
MTSHGARSAGGLLLVVCLCAGLAGVPLAAAEGPDSSVGVTWNARSEVDSGGGHKGPWRMNASEYDYVDDPTVAINARGSIALAWVDQARKDVLFQLHGPEGARRFEQPVNVSRSPGIFSWLPRVVFTGDGDDAVAILWQEIVFSGGSHGGDIFFARSLDGGRSFSEPLNLSRSMSGDGKGRLDPKHWDNGSLDLVAGPQGHLHAAWTDYEGTLWVSDSLDGGARFSKPTRISRGEHARPARAPALAVGSEGTVYLAWTVGEDPSADIHVAKSDGSGRPFGEPRIAVDSNGRADAPKLVLDSQGTVHLVYAESAAGEAGRPSIRYTRSAGGELRFETPRDLAGNGGEPWAGGFPHLAVDGQDGLYVVWELFPEPSARPRGLGFSRSMDGGATFSPPTVVPGTSEPRPGFNGGQQGLLMRKLAVSPAGLIAVGHSTHRPEETSRVWLILGHAQGAGPGFKSRPPRH